MMVKQILVCFIGGLQNATIDPALAPLAMYALHFLSDLSRCKVMQITTEYGYIKSDALKLLTAAAFTL